MPEASGETFDCRSCAACCQDASDGRVLVSAEDLVRWRRAERTDILNQLVPGHFSALGFAARPDGGCQHLGTPESPHDCAIYDTRGASCHAVEPGGAECLAYRRARC